MVLIQNFPKLLFQTVSFGYFAISGIGTRRDGNFALMQVVFQRALFGLRFSRHREAEAPRLVLCHEVRPCCGGWSSSSFAALT